MTRGKEPEWADTPLAQWVKEQLAERGWRKKELEAALLEASDGRLAEAGATGLVTRVTKHGTKPIELNLRLIEKVLGASFETDRLGRVETEVVALTKSQEEGQAVVALLLERVEELERRAGLSSPQARPAELATRGGPARRGKAAR